MTLGPRIPAQVSQRVIQRKILAHAAKWIPRLGLDGWRIIYLWKRSRKEVAWCQAWTHRRRAILNFNIHHIAQYWWRREDWWAGDDELELLVVHELVHATAPSATEGAVHRIATALMIADGAQPPRRIGA